MQRDSTQISPQDKRLGHDLLECAVWGKQASSLPSKYDVARSEAEQVLRQCLQALPGVNNWLRELLRELHQQGFVETIVGRRVYLRNNGPLQQRRAMDVVLDGSLQDLGLHLLHEGAQMPGAEALFSAPMNVYLRFPTRLAKPGSSTFPPSSDCMYRWAKFSLASTMIGLVPAPIHLLTGFHSHNNG